MKNPVAFFLAILALAFAFIAFYQKAHAGDVIRHHGNGDSVATVTFANEEHGTHHIACTGSTVDDIVGVCRETLLSLCPNGGKLSNASESPDGVLPATIEFDVVCTVDGTS